MCTSIISNRKKTVVGWMPLFGANNRGDFVGMPTCWPFDERSNPSGNESILV